jgi:hypothetical protein
MTKITSRVRLGAKELAKIGKISAVVKVATAQSRLKATSRLPRDARS